MPFESRPDPLPPARYLANNKANVLQMILTQFRTGEGKALSHGTVKMMKCGYNKAVLLLIK